MVYHVFANRSNIGDWLSAKGIQKLLAPITVTECLCDEPFIKDTIDQLGQATEEDLIVIGGGGLLMDYFVPFWEAFKPIAERVPFCNWGIGYCDLKNEATLPPIDLIEFIIRRSKLTIVRDHLTKSYLSEITLPSPIACPSINVINPVAEVGNDILHVVNYTTAGADTYEVMSKEAKAFAKGTGRIYRETNNRISNDNDEQMNRIISRYQQSEIILSSALHGCIIGVAMGLKVLAVSGDRKIDAFMESVGLGDWVLDVNEVYLVPKRLKELELQYPPAINIESMRRENLNVAKTIQNLYKNLGVSVTSIL